MASCNKNDDELASSSFWLPSVQVSPPLQSEPLSKPASQAGSAISSGSRVLRPGDWRMAAAAETGGGPVRPPATDFTFTADITPNIDDVHSPASSIFTEGNASPAYNSRRMTPASLSPLRPRVLAVGSALNPAAARATSGGGGPLTTNSGTPALSGGVPPPAVTGSFAATGSPASLSGGEVSFTWQSPSRSEDDEVEQPAQPEAGSPRSPAFGLARVHDDDELSTPGSDGYNSPAINFVAQQQPASIMRSSVHNPLFVDRPTPSETIDAVAKTLALTPCIEPHQSGWSSGSGSASRASQQRSGTQGERGSTTPPPLSAGARAALSSSEPPSPMLPSLDLETPRRSIMGLSAMLSSAAASAITTSTISGLPAISRGKQAETPCSGVSDMGSDVAARSTAKAGTSRAAASAKQTDAATPCSLTALARDTTTASPSFDAGGGTGAVDAVLCRSQAGSPATFTSSPARAALLAVRSRRASLQTEVDDTDGPGRGLDQTPRKGVPSDKTFKEPMPGGRPAGQRRMSFCDVQQEQQQQDTAPKAAGAADTQSGYGNWQQLGNTLWTLTSWTALLTVIAFAALSLMPTMPETLSGHGHYALSKLGPVCFCERYPGAQLQWPASSSRAGPSQAPAILTAAAASTNAPHVGIVTIPQHLQDAASALHPAQLEDAALTATTLVEDIADLPSAIDSTTTAELELGLSQVGSDVKAAAAEVFVAEVQLEVDQTDSEPGPYSFDAPEASVSAPAAEEHAVAPDGAADAATDVEAVPEQVKPVHVPFIEQGHAAPQTMQAGLDGEAEAVGDEQHLSPDTEVATLFSLEEATISPEPQPSDIEVEAASAGPEESAQELPSAEAVSSALSLIDQQPKAAAGSVDDGPSAGDVELQHSPSADGLALSEVQPSPDAQSKFNSGGSRRLRFLGWTLAELFAGCVLACVTGAGLALAVERYGLYPDSEREAAAAAERAVAALQQPVARVTPPVTPINRILKLRTPLRAGAPWSNERAASASDDGVEAPDEGVQRTPAGSFMWMQNRLVYVEGTSE